MGDIQRQGEVPVSSSLVAKQYDATNPSKLHKVTTPHLGDFQRKCGALVSLSHTGRRAVYCTIRFF